MSINSALKKEGIRVVGKLNTLEVNKIATIISESIANSFPEHSINQNDLFISISRLNMYIAEMPNDMAMAKYFYKNNSIYFSKNMNLDDLNTLAVHECIHFMQELKNNSGKLLRLGLYNPKTGNGMAINEAAVQHMASVATEAKTDNVKYYNMELSTISPDFYPIQTTLLNEMIYFTGSYALYHSTFYSNDVFKNTFIAKSSAKTYSKIEKNFDLIFEYEALLSNEIHKLSLYSNNTEKDAEKIQKINNKIDSLKNIIFEKTLETQNIILQNCFEKEFNSIRTIEDIKNFREHLYNFKNVLIYAENYNYFNEFYIEMTNRLEEKQEFIEKYGNILTAQSITNELTSVQENTYGFQFFKTLFSKLKLLFEEFVREKDY